MVKTVKVVAEESLKRPMSAYFLWLNADRDKINKAAGSSKGSEVSKKAAEMWQNVSAKEKKFVPEAFQDFPDCPWLSRILSSILAFWLDFPEKARVRPGFGRSRAAFWPTFRPAGRASSVEKR